MARIKRACDARHADRIAVDQACITNTSPADRHGSVAVVGFGACERTCQPQQFGRQCQQAHIAVSHRKTRLDRTAAGRDGEGSASHRGGGGVTQRCHCGVGAEQISQGEATAIG